MERRRIDSGEIASRAGRVHACFDRSDSGVSGVDSLGRFVRALVVWTDRARRLDGNPGAQGNS
jgi:hypothetical protein